jgi:hypothetical protein
MRLRRAYRRVEVHRGDDIDTLARGGFCAARASTDTHAEPSISVPPHLGRVENPRKEGVTTGHRGAKLNA